MSLITIILAAGKGTRMKSDKSKVIHKVNGTPMIIKIINEVKKLNTEKNYLILGHGKDQVQEVLGKEKNLIYVEQKEQLGTGHAVIEAMKEVKNYDVDIMVLCGDTPLLRYETLENLYKEHKSTNAVSTILTSIYTNPKGYGRIIKENNNVKAIVEEKEASEEIKKIKEVNAGVYCFKGKELKEALEKINNHNEKKEYYLTDVIGIQSAENKLIKNYLLADNEEILGVNSKIELAQASKALRDRKIKELMEDGVVFIDPEMAYIEENVKIGQDTVIYPGVILEGNTEIGSNCKIVGNTRIIDSKIYNNVEIENSVIEESTIEDFATIGPFAHLRPKSHLKEKVHIGNFVETKKSLLEKGVKAGHLTYLGDAHVGENTNIGAGTITCNYDGKNKFKTEIGKNVFIGSSTMLVAPVVLGNDAVTGAGSVITKDVPEDSLAVERSKQTIIKNWRKPKND
ncbi:bifunctional UDP-N-acetylglucosamine diphosphorylase/glucosamine-1-phosphate N-acetyltransferase GlmU [Fusobacterium sp. PH5-44]|uniref:bifunctional UDP-N-acetylglucosamine diphosphorylase/glucosamine-1-phosphate N-acetyltransferase GlmU n=1 Tax=unclassified Fusobacterium TaxID=2648384 RepID=UPI003D1C473E